MDKCHECSEVIDKLNQEYDKIYEEKECLKTKIILKNEIIKDLIFEEKKRKNKYILKIEEFIRNDDRNYNTYKSLIYDIDKNIIDLLKIIV